MQQPFAAFPRHPLLLVGSSLRDAPIPVLVVPSAAALAGAVAEAVLAGTAGAPD